MPTITGFWSSSNLSEGLEPELLMDSLNEDKEASGEPDNHLFGVDKILCMNICMYLGVFSYH